MAYVDLQIDAATPELVKDFIRFQVDMQFHDIHCMLRLPLPEPGLNAGCNFAAANTLLILVSGISTVLYKQTGDSGKRFIRALEDCYPWDCEPSGGY